MQIASVSSIAPTLRVSSPALVGRPTAAPPSSPAARPASAKALPSTASTSAAPATAPPSTAAPARSSHSHAAQARGASGSAAETMVTIYSTTVAGKQYSGSVEEANGEYTASVPNLAGATASGSSAEAAENNLNARIDELV